MTRQRHGAEKRLTTCEKQLELLAKPYGLGCSPAKLDKERGVQYRE